MPLSADRLTPLLATPLGRTGLSAMAGRFLTSLAAEADHLSAPDRSRLQTSTLDLVTALLAARSDQAAKLPPDTRAHVLSLRIDTFIATRLGSPDLTPATIAAAHHISLRTLHRVFRQRGTTVAATVRAQRLERARNDLADPLLRHLDIAAIAARWGFSRPGDFSRAFRAAYGRPPGEYRTPGRRPTGAGTGAGAGAG
ncbi:helix-turn-helix transcriptional regulator [Kitasatospora sp. NBC_01539]|uniref:helix-turn-helix transcriptional regulator n=1 Tax=Kitasatospora sp. NBC_01539 TaxID=2903577 RepID=UPI0038602D0A